MLTRRKFCAGLASAAILYPVISFAEEVENKPIIITLPPPSKQGGGMLLDALSARKSTRPPYSKSKSIDDQTLSNLLWATWGINRADGKRTSPTALNSQEVNLYVIANLGVWLYKEKEHCLHKILDKDYRSKVGGGALVFLYAAPDGYWSGMHVGSIYQNANLYAASVNLGAHVHAGSSDGLAGILRLPLGYRFWIAQSFGYTD